MGVAAILGGPTPYHFRTDPSGISWGYNLNTAVQNTKGGRVIQILSVTITSLEVTVDMGNAHESELKRLLRFCQDLGNWQVEKKEPVKFVYPPRNINLKVFLKGITVSRSLDDVNVKVPISFEVVSDDSGAISRIAMEEALVRIQEGTNYEGIQQEASDAEREEFLQNRQEINKMQGSVGSSATGAGSNAAASGVSGNVESWRPLVIQVLGEVGLPQTEQYISAWLRQIQSESGGRPDVVQGIIDVNSGGNEAAGLVQVIPGCVPMDTEILTKQGWKRFEDINLGDETIGYNEETGSSEWTSITDIVLYPDKPVIELSSGSWSAQVTSGHRWVVDKEHMRVIGRSKTCPECHSEWETKRGMETHLGKKHRIKLSSEVVFSRSTKPTFEISSHEYLVLSERADTSQTLPITPEEAAIIGWLMGDGHVRYDTRTVSASIYQAKPHMVEKIQTLLSDVPHSHTVRKRGKNLPENTFRLRSPYARDLFGRAKIKNRDDAVEFVLSLSSEQREKWLQAIIDAEGHLQVSKDGEGWKPYIRISQKYGALHDAITLAVYLEGDRPSLKPWSRNGKNPKHSDGGMIEVQKPRVYFNNTKKETLKPQNVWCVTTKLGTWTMRQGDQIMLTGNTFAAYRNPDLPNDRFNPHANLYAGMNYAKCVPLEAKILTKRGWLNHDEVVVGDETVGYNPTTKRTQWTLVKEVHHYPSSPLVSFESPRFGKVRFTPNHRWATEKFVQTGTAKPNWKKFELLSSDKIGTRHKVIVGGKLTSNDELPISGDEAEMLGWILGDGHIQQGDSTLDVTVFQSEAKPKHLARIMELFSRVPHTESIIPGNHWSTTPVHRVRLRTEYAKDLMSRSMYLDDPVGMVIGMSEEQRGRFLSGVVGADGHKNSKGSDVITQNLGWKLDVIQLALYLNGMFSKATGRSDNPKIRTIPLSKPLLKGGSKLVNEGSGEVWCVTTELGTWTMKQGETILLTGNSRYGIAGMLNVIGHGHGY